MQPLHESGRRTEGRNFIGIEREAEFFQIASHRIAKAETDIGCSPVAANTDEKQADFRAPVAAHVRRHVPRCRGHIPKSDPRLRSGSAKTFR